MTQLPILHHTHTNKANITLILTWLTVAMANFNCHPYKDMAGKDSAGCLHSRHFEVKQGEIFHVLKLTQSILMDPIHV
jgi:hypothetical protein